MHFLVYLAHPKPRHPDYGNVDGAYISCWINDPIESAADQIARMEIEALDWDIEERDQCRMVERTEFEDDSIALERFDQALVDGWVLSFHEWAVGAPDED